MSDVSRKDLEEALSIVQGRKATYDTIARISPISDEIEKDKALQESRKPENIAVGTRMSDGTIFCGISSDTKQAVYAAPADEVGAFDFYQAKERARQVSAEKGVQYHVPTLIELEMMFNNASIIGGFQVDGKMPECWYWSTTEGFTAAHIMCKSLQDPGYEYNLERTNKICVRLVHT